MRRLLLCALPFGAGTLLCQYLLPQSWRAWSAGGALLLGLAVSLALKGRRRTALRIAAAGLTLGILWFSGYEALFLEPAEALAGSEALVTLELTDYPEEAGHNVRCTVRVLEPALRGRAVYYGGRELMDLEPGNRVTTAAKFYSAAHPGGGDSVYFTSQGIFSRLYGKGDPEIDPGSAGSLRYLPQRLARRLKAAAAELYSPQAGGLIVSLLSGERNVMRAQSRIDLQESGLAHITAVSGLHCGFLIVFLSLLVLRRQRLTLLLGYPVLIGYVVLAGCTPSAVRACVMTGFALLAPLLGRENDPPTSLSAALLALLLFNPFSIASVSLQMSFAAVTGLLLPARRIYRALNRHRPRLGRIGRSVWSFCIGTLSASLGVMVLTAPLSAAYFGSLSLISPLSNLLTLWMAPALFASALVVTAATAVCPALAPLAALPELLAQYLLWAANALAGLPGHSLRFTGTAASLWLVLVYVMLAVCALSRDRERKYLFAAVLAAVCLAAARAFPALSLGDSALTVVAVDVGQGAATLLHAGGSTVLVDCGSLTGGAGSAVADVMDTYGWNRLDAAALTHYHQDHAGGLEELLARVEVDRLLLPQLTESPEQAPLQGEVLALAEAGGVPVTYVEERLELALDGALLTAYPPLSQGDTNEEGLTFLCTAGEFDLLITGDMGADTERRLVETWPLPDIEVLLVGHHGSKYSTAPELLEALAPEVGVISVGAGNTFGHPTPEAMDRMRSAGMDIYRTDQQGNILIRVHRKDG